VGLIILTGFVAAVYYHFIIGAYCHWTYPYNTFLFSPIDAFNDFFNPYNVCVHRNPYGENYSFTSIYYLPLANFFFYIFTLLPRNLSFALYTAIFAISLIALTASQLRVGNKYEYVQNVFIFSLLTYPVIFTMDRGNNEGLLFVSLCASLLIDDSRPILKSLLLAIPIAMKLYPGVFLILLISEKKYKQTAITLAWVVVLTIISLLVFIKGGFITNLKHVMVGFNSNLYNLPIFAWNNQAYSSVGLFFPMKICFRAIDHFLFPITVWSEIRGMYRPICMALFGLLTLYILFVERQRWKKVALLAFAMLLFPEMSGDYKLLHIFLPLFLFINAPTSEKTDWFYACMFGLLLIPKSYYYIPHIITDAGCAAMPIGAFLNQLIMLVTSAVIIVGGFRRRHSLKAPATG
jgi:hypothetical protein